MGFFDLVEDGAKWAGEQLGEAGHWVHQRLDDVGDWFSDLYHGDLGDQAVPAPELVRKVLSSGGAQSWHQGSDQSTELAADHTEISKDIARLSSGLESSWTGAGADAAQARIRPLSAATAAAAETYTTNSSNLSDLAHGFDATKSSMQPLPAAPPHKNLLDQATPWDTDTEREINDYNRIAQENLTRYQSYVQHAQNNGQNLNQDYGQLADFGDQAIHVGSSTDRVAPSGPSESAHQDKESRGPDQGQRGPSDTTSVPKAPAPALAMGNTGATPGSDGQPDWHPAPGPGEGTTAAGWTPPAALPGPANVPVADGVYGGGSGASNNIGGYSAGPSSPGLLGGLGGATGGIGPDRGSSRIGDPVRSGSGTGEGAASRGTANAAVRGAASERGASGVGGVGPSGRKKDEDDKEHQRKYGIDDDSAFSLLDDDGGRLLDPRTGLPPTPPTIGG